MQQERFWAAGAWLLFQALYQDSLKRLPSGPIRHGSELFALIGHRQQADVGAAAGGSDDSSTSFSHHRTISQHQRLSHTTPPDQGPLRPITHMHAHVCSNASQRWRHTVTTHTHIYIYIQQKKRLPHEAEQAGKVKINFNGSYL